MLSFNSICTTPPEGVTFVGAPHIRSTLDIVWGCGSVLLICTWSILHPNVPPQSNIRPDDWKRRYLRSGLRSATRLKWMIINMIVPEWPLVKASVDYLSVRSLAERFEEWSGEDGVPWTTSHTHFANMGGFAIKFADIENASAIGSRISDSPGIREAAKVPSHESNAPAEQLLPTTEPKASPEPDVGPGIEAPKAPPSTDIEPRIREGNKVRSHQSKTPCEQFSPAAGPEDSPGPDVERGIQAPSASDVSDREYTQAFAAQVNSSWAHRMGGIAWHPDEKNEALVAEACRGIRLGHFSNSAENEMFEECRGEGPSGGGGYFGDWIANLAALQGNLWVLDARQLLLARELGIIERLPTLDLDDLADRNK